MKLNNHHIPETKIDPAVANQMLQNIFAECDLPPNTVELEELESYSNYRKDRFLLRKVFTVIVLVLFLLVPLLFLSPEIVSITQTDDSTPTFNMSVETLIPITSVKATIGNKNVPVYESQKHVYTLEPGTEGLMTITVTLLNHQYTQKKVKVTNVDVTAPKVISSKHQNGKLYLTVSDDISGIDFDTITSKDTSGKETKPISVDEKKGTIVFDYPKRSIHIYITDKAGNQLQLMVNIG